MPSRINELMIKEYKHCYQDVNNIISVGYEGLDVMTTNLFRSKLAERNISLDFVKNRIINLAFKELGRPEVREICQGQTAFAVAEDMVGMARFLVDFRKEHKQLKIHGGLLEEQLFDTEGVVTLSQSPNQDELRSIISGQALAMGGKVAGALLGPAHLLAGQLKTRIDELEKKEPA